MRNFVWAGFTAFLIDQVSKYVVIHMMDLARIRSIDVLPPLLNFRYGENRGINFGIGDGVSIWFLVILALVICLAVTIWLLRSNQPFWAQVSGGLLVGGALANVADRLIYGYVLDFLNMSCCGISNPFVFNVADIFVFGGALGLVLFANDKKTPPKPVAKKRQ